MGFSWITHGFIVLVHGFRTGFPSISHGCLVLAYAAHGTLMVYTFMGDPWVIHGTPVGV